ncbi:MAG: hypothetical protein ACIAXF_16385 [Phycisphaerales bacterium JB063]
MTAAFVLSFSDKGWLDQFQEPADEAFALADRSKPEEAAKVLDEVDEQIASFVQSIDDGTAEVDDPERATVHAVRADAAWEIVRQTVAYQSSGDREQWAEQVSELLDGHPESGDAMKYGLELVEPRIDEEDLVALMQAELPIAARGSVVGAIIARRQVAETAPTPADARFLEDILLEVYETPEGASVVTEYVKVQDALGEADAANAVLETMLQLAPDSATGAAAAKARMRDAAEDSGLAVRLYQQYPDTMAGDALRPMYVQALAREGRTAEAIQELVAETWEDRHDEPAKVAALVYSRARTIATNNPTGNTPVPGAGVDICVSLAERLLIEGETVFPAALLLEVLAQGQALPVNQMTRQPLRDATLLGDMADDTEAARVAEYLLGLVQARQDRWEEAKAILTEVAEAPASSTMTRAHAYVALAEGQEADGDFDAAVAAITAASEALPNSLLLRESLRVYESRRVEAEILARLEQEIGSVRAQAESASTPDEAIGYYRQIAELYLSSGFGEQAVGVLVQASEEYPDEAAAPELLRQTVQILQDYQLDNFQARVRVLEQRLEREYPDTNG